ncbi:uncharacterized protein LOC144206043 [Stigmatopora nigra]
MSSCLAPVDLKPEDMAFVPWWLSALTLPLLVVGGIVEQSPADIIGPVGQSAQMKCFVNKLGYRYILWYRLDGGGGEVENLGYMYYGGKFKSEGHLALNCTMKLVMTCILSIPNLRPNNSGDYYCVATSHRAAFREIAQSQTISKTHQETPPPRRFPSSQRISPRTWTTPPPHSEFRDKRGCRTRTRDLGFCASAAPLCSYDQSFFGDGTKLTVLEPNVSITPPTVTFFPPSEYECARGGDPDDVRTLVCAATDFYPDHVAVAWLVDGQKREGGVATDRRALRRGDRYLLTSRLAVPARQWLLGGSNFTCVFTFFNGTAYVDVGKSLRGREGTAEERLDRKNFLKLMQTAKLSYSVLIVKSCVYAGFVTFLLWRRRVSGKTR